MQLSIYGGDHSPWVQAILLAAHERGLPLTLRSLPPWQTFRKWGFLMPVVSIDDSDWMKESADVLAKIGFARLNPEEAQAIKAAWQGVTHRPDNLYRFLSEFSKAGDSGTSALLRTVANFFRAFIALYMLTLMLVARLASKIQDPDDFGEQFLYWERQLAESPGSYLHGEVPDTADFLLFGIVQCHSSVPVPPLANLRTDPRLPDIRQWIATMQTRYCDYPHMYSGSFFSPAAPRPTPASRLQRLSFFCGFITALGLLPITLPLNLYFVVSTPR